MHCLMQARPPARLAQRRSEVVGWQQPPATKHGRFSRLRAYAQAADQHVWSAASVFMGTVRGDLLSPCVCSMCRVARERAARTLRFRGRDIGRAARRIGMHRACLCSCPDHTLPLASWQPLIRSSVSLARGRQLPGGDSSFDDAGVETMPVWRLEPRCCEQARRPLLRTGFASTPGEERRGSATTRTDRRARTRRRGSGLRRTRRARPAGRSSNRRVLPRTKTGREGIADLGRIGRDRVPRVLILEGAVTRRVGARPEPGPFGGRFAGHLCSQAPAGPAVIRSGGDGRGGDRRPHAHDAHRVAAPGVSDRYRATQGV
jgi:hypothetical protein